jgi:integral membrane protein MviN
VALKFCVFELSSIEGLVNLELAKQNKGEASAVNPSSYNLMGQDIDHPHTITKSALSFLSGTALSRIGGFIRDVSMTFYFGTNSSIAAFWVALRLASLLRGILGEGALLNSFVPHFESHRNENPKYAAEFFRDTFYSLVLLLILLIGLIEIAIYSWTLVFSTTPENQQILHLIMIILPGVLFICLFGICSGFLHCEKSFFLTGISPVAYNTIWIMSVLILKDYAPQKAVVGLSLGITIAFLCQWLITFPKTISLLRTHLSWKEFLQCQLFSPRIRIMISSLSLGIIGITAAQINTAVGIIFARFASLEGPAYLNYAMHLQQLPLALFGVAISSAFLPPLSRAIKSNNTQYFNRLLEFSLSISLFIIIPCTIAIYALGGSSVNLIFGRGSFDHHSTLHTILCLWGYGFGLIPMVITTLLAPAFYAKKQFRAPMIASLISIAISLLLNILFVCIFRFGPESLAVSASMAAFCNAWLLYKLLSREMDIALPRSFFYSMLKTTVCAGLAGITTICIGSWVLNDLTIPMIFGLEVQFTRNFSEQIFQFIGLFLTFCATFIISAMILKNKELTELINMARRRRQITS